MIIEFDNTAIFIRPGNTDARKAINGLAIIVEQEMKKDPFARAIFLFRNRTGRILKALYWDRNGFCLWQKKLEKEKFPWPQTEQDAREISLDELQMLLKGIDFFKAHKQLHFSSVS